MDNEFSDSGQAVKPEFQTDEGAPVQHLGTLELREELPVIERQQVQTGQVRFRREVKLRTETVMVELRSETLYIETGPGEAAVYLGDELLLPGESRELLLYDERVQVSKQPYVSEEVRIGKRVLTEIQETPLELEYEVLVTEELSAEELGAEQVGHERAGAPPAHGD